MKLRSAVGVLIGGITDIVASYMLSLPLMMYIASLGPNLSRAPAILQAAAWLLGLMTTVLGGYVAAFITRAAHVRSGALSSWLCVTTGVLGMFAAPSATPPWQHLLALVLAPMFGAVGGYLRLRQAEGRRGASEV